MSKDFTRLLDLSDELYRLQNLAAIVVVMGGNPHDDFPKALSELGQTINERFENAMANLEGIIADARQKQGTHTPTI